jgi:hypothetical protein
MATQAELDGYIPKSIVDAKGDLIGASAADTPVRLAKGPQGYYLFSDSTQTAGLGWNHPLEAIDVVREGGLVDDQTTTDNSAALQALVDDVDYNSGDGRFAYFIFPKVLTGKYKFLTQVNVGPRPIHFIGFGATYNDPRFMISMFAGTNGMTIFSIAQDTIYQQGPRIENICFNGLNVTTVVGVDISGVNRVQMRNVVFLGCATAGLRMDSSPVDCAWHDIQNIGFVLCGTGLLSLASNNWFARALWGLNCTIGFDFVGSSANINIDGITWHANANNTIGIRSNGSSNRFAGIMFEAGAASAGPRTLVQINGDGTQTRGQGHHIHVVSAHGGSGAGNTNKIIDFTANTRDNYYKIDWLSGFPNGAEVVSDAGTYNTDLGTYRRVPHFPNSIAIAGIAGAVSDAAFQIPSDVPDNTISLDTTNKRLFAKIGGVYYQTTLSVYVPPLLTNDFEGGVDGTTITTGNSGGASGDAFDFIDIEADATLKYDNDHVYDTLSCKITTPVTARQVNFGWEAASLGGTGTDHYGAFRMYHTAFPGATLRLMAVKLATSTQIALRMGTDGKLSWVDGSGTILPKSGGGSATTTNAISLNQFVRLEYHIIHNATTGVAQLLLFNDPDSGTPTETLTTAATDTGGGFDAIYYGVTSAISNAAFWMDTMTANATAYPGP